MLGKCCYAIALMYAYYNSHKLFFMSNNITEMIPETRKATLAVIIVECLGNGIFTKSIISILISLIYMRVFALYLCYTPSTRGAMGVKVELRWCSRLCSSVLLCISCTVYSSVQCGGLIHWVHYSVFQPKKIIWINHVCLISCRYNAMIDQFYHVVLPDLHKPRTSAVFVVCPWFVASTCQYQKVWCFHPQRSNGFCSLITLLGSVDDVL